MSVATTSFSPTSPTSPASSLAAGAAPPLGRPHLTRLMQVWRSAGWPCRDAIELDLLAAGCVARALAHGHETLRITDTGLAHLATARQKQQRAASPHDRLAQRVARQLMDAGRLVWRELSLRAQVQAHAAADPALPAAGEVLLPDAAPAALPPAARAVWRMARPDVFSIRHTTVPAYLRPVVHEVKVSRADLLCDLRHEAKRQAYQWLCSECCYVFPAGMAEPQELPEDFGVWVVHGSVHDGRLECLRPARHQACQLPFAVWMALAKASPLGADLEAPQALLAEQTMEPAEADPSEPGVASPA